MKKPTIYPINNTTESEFASTWSLKKALKKHDAMDIYKLLIERFGGTTGTQSWPLESGVRRNEKGGRYMAHRVKFDKWIPDLITSIRQSRINKGSIKLP